MGPFTPAITMKPVRLEPAPERGSADTERSGRFGQLPAVRVQRLDDSLLFSGCQCSGAHEARDEHGLAQLEASHPERPKPAPQGCQPRLKIARAFIKIHPSQSFPGRLVGVE